MKVTTSREPLCRTPSVRTSNSAGRSGPPLEPEFFPKLSRTSRSALAGIAQRRTFRPGQTVQTEGVPSDRLVVILSGQAKVCRMTPAGKNLILSLLAPGDLFGVAAAMGGEIPVNTVITLSEVEAMVLRREPVFGLLARQPELLREVLPMMTGRASECSHCLIEASCSKVEVRFARLFCDLAERQGRRDDRGVVVSVKLSRQELADLTATTIESAIRLMTRWSREGWVETEKEGFLIRDLAALEDLALE